MRISSLQRGIYNHQADRIEKALSSLALPTRVHGGEIARDRVRYHLSQFPQVPIKQVGEIASKVAEAMGVYKVHMDEKEEGWVLDLLLEEDFQLRLLPLIEDLNNLLPVTTVLGIAANGKPLLINLRREETRNVLIYGPSGSGKSELLRTLVLSLALKHRSSQVQFLGIDLSGKELTVMDALPHALSEVAMDAVYAEEVIDWLAQEVVRRKEARVMHPDVVLVIDELENVMHYSETLLQKLPLILEDGLKTGVHLVATSKEIRPGSFMPNWRKSGMVIAKAGNKSTQTRMMEIEKGKFEFQICGEKITAQVAWLPARDLQQAVARVQTGWRAEDAGVDLKLLWK
jgi:energy-coupling factor transporter ATP-binding protein EcfA2